MQRLCVCALSPARLCHPTACNPPGSSAKGISQQECWSGLPFPSPGGLPDPGVASSSPSLQGALCRGAAQRPAVPVAVILAFLLDLPRQPGPQDTTAVWGVAWDRRQLVVSEPGAEASPVSVCATSALSYVPSKPSVRAARSPCGTESDCRVEQHLERAASAERHAGKLGSREVRRRAWGHTAVTELGGLNPNSREWRTLGFWDPARLGTCRGKVLPHLLPLLWGIHCPQGWPGTHP